VDDRSETGLALDNGVWDTHLLAESGKEDNELDGVDIVGDEDEGSLLVLNEANNVVETVLDGVGLLGDILLLLALGDGGGLLGQALLLLGLGLRAVLVEELEGLGSGVAVQNLGELGDGRGDLQAHVEDLALTLKADILGPAHHAREVATGLDVLADTEVTGTSLDERVLSDMSARGLREVSREDIGKLTLAFFLETPALPWGKAGAAATFFPDLGAFIEKSKSAQCSLLLTLKGCAVSRRSPSHWSLPSPMFQGEATTIDVDVEHHLEMLRSQASETCKAHRRIALQRRQRFKVLECGASLPF